MQQRVNLYSYIFSTTCISKKKHCSIGSVFSVTSMIYKKIEAQKEIKDFQFEKTIFFIDFIQPLCIYHQYENLLKISKCWQSVGYNLIICEKLLKISSSASVFKAIKPELKDILKEYQEKLHAVLLLSTDCR